MNESSVYICADVSWLKLVASRLKLDSNERLGPLNTHQSLRIDLCCH